MSDGDGTETAPIVVPIEVEVPWRRLNNWGATFASGLFALALFYLAATSEQFTGVYRAVLVLAGLGLVYVSCCFLLNRTRVLLDDTTLRLLHGPMPWPGAAAFPREAIARLHANRQTRRLELRTTLGQEHVLLTSLPEDILAELDEQFCARFRE